MYPRGELAELEARKEALRRRIATTRLECMLNATEVTRPLARVDQAIETWRQFQPLVRLATVPLGVWLLRSFSRRFRVVSSLLRWAPLVLSVVRGFTQPAEASSTGSPRRAG